MRRFLIVLVTTTLAIGLLPVPAQSSHSVNVQGTILFGQPSGKFVGGITELGGACGLIPQLQGIDGWWVNLGHEGAGRTGRVDQVSATAVDIDVWFFDAGCSWITADDSPHAYSMASGIEEPTVTPQGRIPDKARYAIVNLTAGAAADFRFRVL